MLELVLWALSCAIYLQLLFKRDSGKVWGWITAYWAVLFFRNAMEVAK